MAADWQPDLADTELLEIVSGWPPKRLEREVRQFRDHAAANARHLADWQAGFRTWLRNAPDPSAQSDDGRGQFRASGNGLFDACREHGE